MNLSRISTLSFIAFTLSAIISLSGFIWFDWLLVVKVFGTLTYLALVSFGVMVIVKPDTE